MVVVVLLLPLEGQAELLQRQQQANRCSGIRCWAARRLRLRGGRLVDGMVGAGVGVGVVRGEEIQTLILPRFCAPVFAMEPDPATAHAGSPLEAEALSLQEFVLLLQLEDANELANGAFLVLFWFSWSSSCSL